MVQSFIKISIIAVVALAVVWSSFWTSVVFSPIWLPIFVVFSPIWLPVTSFLSFCVVCSSLFFFRNWILEFIKDGLRRLADFYKFMAEESSSDSNLAIWLPVSVAAVLASIFVASCVYFRKTISKCCSRGGRTATKDSSDSSDGLIDSPHNDAPGRLQFGATGTHGPIGPLSGVERSSQRPSQRSSWIPNQLRAREALRIKHPGKVHIALCGTAKGGKSTLINCLTNSKSARVSALEKNTKTTTNTWGNITLHELPSTDIISGETAEQYCASNNLDAFDQILFATGPMVREKDLQIASLVANAGIPCIFVRTQCDNDLNPPAPYRDAQRARKEELKEQGVSSFEKEFQKFQSLEGSLLYFVSKVGFINSEDAFELDEKRLLDDISRATALNAIAETSHRFNDRKKQ